MLYRSTEGGPLRVPFFNALLDGLAPDKGLYMPDNFPVSLEIDGETFPDRACQLLWNFVPRNGLSRLCHEVFNFPVPLKQIGDNLFISELFHGPTLSFKDFGARFMARAMAVANGGSGKVVNIVVATSGDTGSAVASAFHNVPWFRVFVLYPKGRVTDFQEKQMTTLGGNVSALEVAGDFDDCQRIAKELLGDRELSKELNLSSANSINIGRLLPQMTYYLEATHQLRCKYGRKERPIVVVPSGNFGNLTAGMFARKMGVPIEFFVAAVNINSAIPDYLATGKLHAPETTPTISNAMDVGNPSNWRRIVDLYGGDRAKILNILKAITADDNETKEAMFRCHDQCGYIADPHTSVGLYAADRVAKMGFSKTPIIVLSTAHPAKFRETVEGVLRVPVPLPPVLAEVMKKEKLSVKVAPNKEEVVKRIKAAQ